MDLSSKKKKVLVVDDEPDMRIFLARLLELGGYEPISAGSAAEGFEILARDRPDLIVLAVMFDREGRLQMLEDLKEDERFRRIPVVLVSSIDQKTLYKLRALPGVSRRGFLPRPDGILAKPPEADDLLGLLRSLSGGQRPVRPATE